MFPQCNLQGNAQWRKKSIYWRKGEGKNSFTFNDIVSWAFSLKANKTNKEFSNYIYNKKKNLTVTLGGYDYKKNSLKILSIIPYLEKFKKVFMG